MKILLNRVIELIHKPIKKWAIGDAGKLQLPLGGWGEYSEIVKNAVRLR